VTNNESQILDIVRSGNSRAYAVLVDNHKEKAMTLAVRMLGSREEAEEIVQDAFLKAYRNLDQFRGDAKFSTWLYRILYNLCITRVTRRKGKMETLDPEEDLSRELAISEDTISVQERMEHEELRGLMVSEIEKLPARLKSVVLLFYIQEMSYEEISAVTNTPLGSVKTYLHRGRNLLRKRLVGQLKGEVSVS
jgi:RNA polymerase sigma-70 factor (ECF subfamily)